MAHSKWEDVQKRFAEIEIWLKKGLSEQQIFNNLRIGKTTWEKYKHIYPELSELLKNGRAKQIDEVVNSLYKTATGYTYRETQAVKCKEVYYDDEGRRCEREVLNTAEVMKFHAPEVAAMAFFLKNKDRKNWADNPQAIDLRQKELEHRIQTDSFKEW